ncbi:MAG: ABC transporter ATP-binding protein [Pseudomonadota bacterium]
MPAPTTLSARNLTRFHGKRKVVDDVSFDLHRGEVLGLLGHNGAGKSTTLQMLAGALQPQGGSVEVCEFDLAKRPDLGKACLGFLPEHPPLYRDMRVDDQLLFAARLHRLPKSALPAALELAKRRCGLLDSGRRLIGELSKGYQQRVGIAQAIIHQPAVVILDEPTVGLDPAQIRDIRELIRELGDQSSVILSTHLLHEVEQLCDRAVVLRQGRNIFDGTLDELRAHSDLEAAFLQLNGTPEAA